MAVVFGMSRHGESEQNLAVRALLAGEYEEYWRLRQVYDEPADCRLTLAGEAQARALRPILQAFTSRWEGRRIVVYASPYTRAWRTAEIVCKGWYHGPIIPEPLLRERSWGFLERERFTSANAESYSKRAKRLIRYPSYRPRGGESVYDRYGDVESFVTRVRHAHADDIVWTFAHGEILRMMQMVQRGLDAKQWVDHQHPIHNCHSEAWLRICPETAAIYNAPRWRSVVHCPQTNPDGSVIWSPL